MISRQHPLFLSIFSLILAFALGACGAVESIIATPVPTARPTATPIPFQQLTSSNISRLAEIASTEINLRNLGASALSPDRRTMAIGNGSSVVIFNLATRQSNTVNISGAYINASPGAIAFSRDGQHIAAASRDDVYVINVSSRSVVATLTGHDEEVNAVAFSPVDPILVTGSEDRSMRFWSTSTWRLADSRTYRDAFGIREGLGSDSIYSLFYVPNGEVLVVGTTYGRIDFLNVASKEFDEYTLTPGLFDQGRAEQMLPTAAGLLLTLTGDDIIGWNLQTARISLNIEPSFYSFNMFSLNPDGSLIAGSGTTDFGIFNAATGTELKTVDLGFGASSYSAAIHWLDARTIVTVNKEGVKYWGVRG